LSKDDKQLMRITKLDLTSDPYAAVMKKIDVTGRPTRGNKDAKVVVVNFDDFECPFCSRMHATLFPEILKEYGDKVLFVYKDYPIQEIHPWATRAAIDANCLGVQNNDAYWDFADYIHGHQHDISAEKDQSAAVDRLVVTQGQLHHLDSDKLEACIKAQNDEAIKKSEHEGDSVGVSATPTMFINGQELDGALPISEVRAALDNALVQAGVTPPAHPSDKTALPSSAAPSTAPTAAAPTPGK
jgi:protein-disulfide isomerase